jgi:indole-3-glycerol phosphate synthase
MTDLLAKICADKRAHIDHLKQAKSRAILDQDARHASPPRGFTRALRTRLQFQELGIIAEIKKASPSAGLIRADFSPSALARDYECAEATCLSVLTDGPYFQGCNNDLIAARAACHLPVLRKDFMLDVWQIAEARSIGADCILLIMAALNNREAEDLHTATLDYGMDVLIEIHDRVELDRALKLPGGIIGINNRDLKTLKVSLRTTEDLKILIPPDRIVVSESGVSSAGDIIRIRRAGVHCILVGESLLKQEKVGDALKALTTPGL